MFQSPTRFDLAVVVGRFCPVHNGHVNLFSTALSHAKRLLILVGSSQEYGTLRNPFRIETRINAIKELCFDVNEDIVMIRALPDLTNELDISDAWGSYLKKEIEYHMHKFASLMVYGNDEFRSNWFKKEDLVNTAELILQRNTIPISATMARGFILTDQETEWQKITPELLHSMYPRLRRELMGVPVYQEIYNRIRKMDDLSLSNFYQIYREYEEQDRKEKLAKIGK